MKSGAGAATSFRDCLRHFFLFNAVLFISLTNVNVPSSFANADDPSVKKWIEIAHARKLHESRMWQMLLHYRPRTFVGRIWSEVKSEVDARGFFLSPEGRTNPWAELEATLQALADPKPSDPAQNYQHPQCRFIDRYSWLKKELGFTDQDIRPDDCSDFKEWRAVHDPGSITLIFSSYYINNPSSMFGHTLLRLNNRKHSSSERILDYGVNYAANPTTSNPILYALLGLTGGFDGVFSNMPYYLKVEEYNNVESRDLWEYELSFEGEQIDRLMEHLWTLGHVPISYYYLTQNCSYMILTLMDVADPTLRLADEFRGLVVPADTLRAIKSRPTLVRNAKFRPSLATRMERQFQTMTREQKKNFEELKAQNASETWRVPEGDPAQIAPALDLWIDYLKYRKVDKSTREKANLLRSDYPVKQPEPQFPDPTPPEASHPSALIRAGLGSEGGGRSFIDLGYRMSLHDLNGDPTGLPVYAQIVMGEIGFRFYPLHVRDSAQGSRHDPITNMAEMPSRFRLETLKLVDVISLSPWHPLFRKISWTMSLTAERPLGIECQSGGQCLEARGGAGAGYTSPPLLNFASLYGLGILEATHNWDTDQNWRLAPELVLGAISGTSSANASSWTKKAGFHASVEMRPANLGYRRAPWVLGGEVRLSLSSKTELRLTGKVSLSEREVQRMQQAQVSLYAYF